MACFKANTMRMSESVAQLRQMAQRLDDISENLQDTAGGRGITAASYWVIRSRINSAARVVEEEKNQTVEMVTRLDEVVRMYTSLEQKLAEAAAVSLKLQDQPSENSTGDSTGDNADNDSFAEVFERIHFWFTDCVIDKPYVLPTILNIVSPGAGILYLTSGVALGKTPSFLDYSRTPSASTDADWFGYELANDHPSVTAWIGKAQAEAQNEWGYAGVNGYLGKVEAKADADFGLMKKNTKTMYKNGEWVTKERLAFLTAEAGAGVAGSILAGDAKAGVGTDMLGLDGKASGGIGNATAEAKGKISVGEDGVNAYAQGKAMVSAVEGKASGTINILGIEITGEVGGYAGALGVEGKIGIEDNKFVMRGGAAALIGGSAGIEIGFNEEGWDNFVDFVMFWE